MVQERHPSGPRPLSRFPEQPLRSEAPIFALVYVFVRLFVRAIAERPVNIG
jgi:hypothetical protein